MSVYFLGCAHLGHNNIGKFRTFVKDGQDNIRLIQEDWNKRINKNDLIFCLGDTAFSKEGLDIIGNSKGRKILVSGNHENLVSFQDKCAVFEEIHGIIRYKKMWLTHCPIHPDEMRRCVGNVHAHIHSHKLTVRNWYGRKIPDKRYLNTCVDVVYPKYGTVFLSLDQAKSHFNL